MYKAKKERLQKKLDKKKYVSKNEMYVMKLCA